MKVARILLVEDNPIMSKLVCAALAARDIHVTEARAGAQALGLWAAQPSDLVLQDLMLPDMDGFELPIRLRGLPGGGEVPILALSGLLSQTQEARISAVGFNDVIIKPIEVSRLRQIVRAHLPQVGAPSARFGAGRRILIVDDDPLQAKLMAFRFARLGFHTTTAPDGLEALRLARLSAPDAIVSDIMMPALDGFGLCAAVRQDASLAGIPLLLVTNNYVDEADRELARTAGADEFVIRTPNMVEVIDALRQSLSASAPRPSVAPDSPDRVEQGWTRRVMSQLERQVAINTSVARRCSMLSAELVVLSGISDALARQDDIHGALTNVLGACVDAGGFALGALQLSPGLPSQLLTFGQWNGWSETEIRSLLDRAARSLASFSGQALLISTPGAMRELSPQLEASHLSTAIVVPVTRAGLFFGTLLMGSKANALDQEDRLAFLEGVAKQIAQALALAQAFAEKDASEKKEKEQARVLRSVLDTVAEGVVVTDVHGEFLLWNPAAEEVLGTGTAHVPARLWPERFGLMSGDEMKPVRVEQVPLVRALAGEVVDDGEPFFLNHDGAGSGKYVTISARPLKDHDSVVGAVAVLRDVTEQKSTQARLLVADRLASIGMLAAGVAHEINNPLTAVIGNLELCADVLAELPERAELRQLAGMLRDCRDAANRVQHIARDLRVFSRAEADGNAAVDLHEVLEAVLRLASNEIRHRARVVRDYGDVLPAHGNESRLSQVFLNLVMNAVQALPDGRADENELRITTRMAPGGGIVVTVADTGEGIDPEAMKRLFMPFFTTKGPGMGTGLGLSICQRLVTAIGGDITVDSRPGAGTKFHVTLRSALELEKPTPPEPAMYQRSRAARRGRILVVDDESSILSILSRVIEVEHDCVAVNTASRALELLLGDERFDMIICDLMMPVMNGMELYLKLDLLAPEQAQKLIFLTGGAFTPALRAFLARVPNECIEKPFDVSRLKAVINTRLS